MLKGLGVTPVERREVPSDLRKPLGSAADICGVAGNTPSGDSARWTGAGAECASEAGGEGEEELCT